MLEAQKAKYRKLHEDKQARNITCFLDNITFIIADFGLLKSATNIINWYWIVLHFFFIAYIPSLFDFFEPP